MLASTFAKTRRTILSIFILFAMVLLGAGQTYAQVAGAMLKGTFTDATGATVPKAQVSVIDVATGIAHNVTTDAAGTYSAANLRPGEYQVRVTATGFNVDCAGAD
jgi:hypothetical protein